MINKKFIQKLKEAYEAHEIERRRIISGSNDVLNASKRAIFSVHREDLVRAGGLIAEAEKKMQEMDKQFGFNRLLEEGAYKAGMEEYTEAKLLFLLANGKKLDQIKEVKLATESYLGGMCDLTGELVRQAINQAAAGKFEAVNKTKDIISDIMAELVEFDMTGYQRTKYDQARGNLKKIEQIAYEINLRK